MTKDELIGAVAASANVSKADVKAVIENTFGIIKQTAEAGDRLRVPGFGTFETKHRKARTGRNPRTGEPVQIAASSKLTFRAAKSA